MAIDTKIQETLNSNNQSILMRRGGSPEPSCQLPTTPAHFYKSCSKCRQRKLIEEFYKNSTTKDGYQYQCKICSNNHQKKYRQTKQGKANTKRYHNRHPERIKIKNLVNHAIRAGKLPRPDTLFCTYCYEMAQHYHHPDYSKPLEVIPLCRKCHRKIHEVPAPTAVY